MSAEAYVLKIAREDQIPDGQEELSATAKVWGGGYVVRVGGGEVDLTRDMLKAGRFETEQEAMAFTRLPEMQSLPIVVVRLRALPGGNHGA